MSERIYLDANVWLDYFEDRKDSIRPLGEFAFQVFKRALKCEFEIVASEWLLEELHKHANKELLKNILQELYQRHKLILEEITDNDIKEVNESDKQIHCEDLRHYVFCKNHAIKFLVSRDRHLLEAGNGVVVVLPEEL
ncbi:PIN domain-containing protein [archaeon]|nr:PIN domain-containing protein [archaeon]